MKFEARFKEKWGIDKEDLTTVDGWTEYIEADNLEEALKKGSERCKELESKISGEKGVTQITFEIEVSIRP